MRKKRLNPSAAHRWSRCAASPSREMNYPYEKSTEKATEGTGTHLLVYLSLSENKGPLSWLNRVIGVGDRDKPCGWTVTEHMCNRAQKAYEYVKTRMHELKDDSPELLLEQRSNPGKFFGRTNWNGKLDIAIVTYAMVETIDYKDGGFYVDVNNNEQLISMAGGLTGPLWCYAPSVKHKMCIQTIIQPKIRKNPVRSERLRATELWNQVKQLAHKADLTDVPDPLATPGDHCTFCAHKNNCVERGQSLNVNNASIVSDEMIKDIGKAVAHMSGLELAELLDQEPLVLSRFKEVREEAEKRHASEPGSVPRYSMVSSRIDTRWLDDIELVKKKLKGMRIKNDVMNKTDLATPSQLLKSPDISDAHKQRIRDELTRSVPTKPKIGPAKGPSIDDVFADVTFEAPKTEPTEGDVFIDVVFEKPEPYTVPIGFTF